MYVYVAAHLHVSMCSMYTREWTDTCLGAYLQIRRERGCMPIYRYNGTLVHSIIMVEYVRLYAV